MALCAVGLSGCDALLDVKNPNNVTQEALEDPVAAGALVAGATAEVADGLVTLLRSVSTISDETQWIGSQNAAQAHDQGEIRNPDNEYSGETFNQMSEGRWLADYTIQSLEKFDADGDLANRDLLAQAYLQGGIIYAYIGAHFDAFVLSNRTEAAPPIDEAGMVKMFDTAIGYLDKGLAVARAAGNKTRELELLAVRAKTNYSKALWAKVNPTVNTASPLVVSAEAASDARAALALAPGVDWTYRYEFSPTTLSNDIGNWLTQRFEVRLSDAVAVADPTNTKVTTAIRLLDPIDQVPAPYATELMKAFYADREYWPLRVVSARELYLILAENALAQGNVSEAATHLNAIRAADGLTALSATASPALALDVLKHMRRTQLLLTGARLTDQYRFDEPAQEWLGTSDARSEPGAFFPITREEINANCHINGLGCS